MRYPIRLAALLLAAACASAEPEPASPIPSPTLPPAALPAAPDPAAGTALPTGFTYPADDTVRVVTWNVEHFVDSYDNPYVDNPRENRPPDEMPQRRKRLARVLRALDADVVVLQEFESAAYLQALARELFPEMGYRFFVGTESPTWYQNVVVMSRLPLGVLRSYAHVATPVEGAIDEQGRPEVQSLVNNRMWMLDVLARPGYTFTLAGLHLKAGRTPRDVGFRTGQIRFLHTEFGRLLRERPDANLLVAGDLNSVPGSPEFLLLLGGGGVVRLVDPFADQRAPTHPAGAPTRQLDHLLPNQNMFPELVPGSARVATPLPREEMVSTSDHLPVVAEFLARDPEI